MEAIVLCSVLCLGAFASSYWLSSGTAKLDQAVLLAEEKAETLKVSHEPAANLSETFAETGLRITVTPAETKTGLASARIQVFDAETGRRIHEITAAWQIAIMEEGES